MAKTQQSQEWPPYPHIPIYLETSGSNGTARSYRSISPRPPSIETQTKKPSIQYLAAASTQFSNMSTNLSPVSATTQFTNISPIWPIPEPEPLPQPPPEVAQQPSRRRPALRFFPTSQPRLQFETSPEIQTNKQNVDDAQPKRKSKLGLGIQDAPSTQSPISIPSPTSEMDKRSSNIAQRIEEGLWRYSLSGNVLKRWLLEIISWLVSAICMGTIIGFLIFYQNKKIPNWPSSLTLNAFIAILSKISGAALILPVSEALGQLKWSWFQGHSKTMWDFEIFDNASRGPWGSFLLLIRTKGKALAALGAIITLFSLALDPFFQQVVDFPDRWQLQGRSSEIPRAIHYEPPYNPDFRAGGVIAVKDQDVWAVARKYLFENGTQPIPFGNGTRPDIPIACPTGNCTWPAYQSLGVCSRCADVSDLLTFTCLNTTVDWVANLDGGVDMEKKYPNGTVCGYFMNMTGGPDIPTMLSGYLTENVKSPQGSALKGEVLLSRLMPLTKNPTKQPIYGGSIHFKNIRNPIIDFLIVSAANGSQSVFRNETPIAHECVLSWCVKTIHSKYFGATYEEEILEVFENSTVDGTPWKSEPFKAPGFNGTNVFYRENVTITAPLSVNGSDITAFGLGNVTFLNVASNFDDVVPSVYTKTNATATPTLRYKTYATGAAYQRTMDFNPWYQSENLTNHMERMATALTNVVRSSPNGPPVFGDAWFVETYVLVRWEWLALPVSLLVLTLVFLLATMRKTAKEGVWKTSAIATLLYGLPDDMQRKITTAAENGTPRAKAKELKVKLHGNKGWRVSGNLFSPLTPKPSQHQPPPGWI